MAKQMSTPYGSTKTPWDIANSPRITESQARALMQQSVKPAEYYHQGTEKSLQAQQSVATKPADNGTTAAKPAINYEALLSAYSEGLAIRRQEAEQKRDEEIRLLSDAIAATKARREADYQQSVNAEQSASAENLRHAYIEKELAKRDLPQKQSAMGISGGASLSGEMRLQSGYQKERAAEQARAAQKIGSLQQANQAAALQEEESYAAQKSKAEETMRKTIDAALKAFESQMSAAFKKR